MSEYQQDGGPTYGERVRAARKDQGLSQKGLAGGIGVSSQYLCDIEFGRRTPSAEVAGRIWFALGIRMESVGETTLREALTKMLEAAERAHMGHPLPAEEWFALKDYALSLI